MQLRLESVHHRAAAALEGVASRQHRRLRGVRAVLEPRRAPTSLDSNRRARSCGCAARCERRARVQGCSLHPLSKGAKISKGCASGAALRLRLRRRPPRRYGYGSALATELRLRLRSGTRLRLRRSMAQAAEVQGMALNTPVRGYGPHPQYYHGRFRCRCRCAGPPIGVVGQDMAYFVRVTSINPRHLTRQMNSIHGRSVFILGQPLLYPLYAYYEGSAEGLALPEQKNLSWVPLDVHQPWARRYVEQQSNLNSSVQIKYKNAAHEFRKPLFSRSYYCVAHASGFCKDIYTAYNVAAIYDAVTQKRGQYIVWMDSDTQMRRFPDDSFWKWHRLYDVATMFRQETYPETGIMVFHATSDARKPLCMALGRV